MMDFPVFPHGQQGHRYKRNSGHTHPPQVGWCLVAPTTLHSQVRFFGQEFAMPIEISNQDIHPADLRDEVRRAILKRSSA